MARMSPLEVRLALVIFAAMPGMVAAQAALHAPLPAQGETTGWNWADDGSRVSRSAQFAASRAICQRLRRLEPRAADWPDPAAAAMLADCDSAALYYGIGEIADAVRARQCALLETQRADSNGGPFSGTAMLMTIYANGVGAERNLDLATSLACRVDGAAFEVDGRVRHLQKLEAGHWSGHDFSYCDDISSGMAAGLCAEHEASIASAARSDKLDDLSRSWTAAERARFELLLDTMRTYARASSENEVDLGGTARAAFMLEREQDVKDQLAKLLDALQEGSLPAASAVDGESADAQLNQVYRQVMAIEPDGDGRIGAGTVTQSGIREAQRAWLPYRDAWIAFAVVKYPQASASSLQAALTRQRIKDLQDFVPAPPAAGTEPTRPARAIAVNFHPLPATAAGVLAGARGIVTGGRANAKPVVQVIFDPNAPSDAALWRNLQRQHPELTVRWLPVGYFRKDSAALAATLLDAADPAAALAKNFDQYDRRARHGGVQPEQGKTPDAGQAALRAAWGGYGGYTPMIVVRDADGNAQQTGGANPEVIEAALRTARSRP